MSEKKHALFGASTAKRWMNCAASFRLSQGMPELPEGAAAREGTLTHECLERFFTDHKAGIPTARTRKSLRVDHPESMVDRAEHAFKVILGMAKGREVQSETRCDLVHLDKDMWGTTDALIPELFGRLEVIDYKNGRWLVETEDNEQLIFYALAAAHQFDYNFEDVRITIIQPNAEHKDGTVRSVVLEIDELLAWGEKFKKAAKRARAKDAPTNPGEWCHFCPAASVCPEVSKKAMGQTKVEFEPITSTQSLTLPPIQNLRANLPTILDGVEKLEKWIGSVRQFAFMELNQGRAVKGWKLVDKQARRKWAKPEVAGRAASAGIGEDAFEEPTLKSPAQIEKLGKEGKRFVAKFAVAVSSGVTLARESDRRPAVTHAAVEFSDLDLEEIDQ